MAYEYDAVVVGAGPNGLAAGITLAQRGLKVLIMEGASQPGGGMRTSELTLPGYRHDVCAAIHPMALASPFFQGLQLERNGVEWIHPDVPLAHPLDGGEVALLQRSVAATAESLGPDASAYFRLMQDWVERWPFVDRELLGPLGFPRRPFSLAWLGLQSLFPASTFLRWRFKTSQARALMAGIAAHSTLPLEWSPSMSVGLVMAAVGHRYGWPLVAGGSANLAAALVQIFRGLGGEIVCDRWVEKWEDVPPARLVMLDIGVHQFLKLADSRLPWWYRRALQRYCTSPGVFKIDYALSGPVPWQNPQVARAGTVHLGGTLEDLAVSERAAWQGRASTRPYVLVSQPSLFDSQRAPTGKHTLWAYCHVPHGCTVDMTEAIEYQIERFAPGFRDLILHRSTISPAQYEAYNPSYLGGDITGGALLLSQLFTRPTIGLPPYATPLRGVYLCSSATPPGGGVHGLCGHHAALAGFRRYFQ